MSQLGIYYYIGGPIRVLEIDQIKTWVETSKSFAKLRESPTHVLYGFDKNMFESSIIIIFQEKLRFHLLHRYI